MKTISKNIIILALLTISMSLGVSTATCQEYASDPQFKVKLDFNRWHDVHELYDDMRKLEKAYPDFLTLESVGKSYDGLDIMVMKINNPKTGDEMDKAAMHIEANIHGNEIQGGEVCLYTIWYLMENYGKLEKITNLVDERVFYIFPTVNPDGRQYFMEKEGGGARTGHFPVDDDNDGLYEEDPPNDLNGNGVIEQIRKYVPGEGNYKISIEDPRIMVPCEKGEVGDYIMLGSEGIDDDNDGRVNEDGPGGYDPNRNWGSNWQPNYIQGGAMDYPFQLPETKAMNDFMIAHPNIAGLQSYHNSGGMILRGPGSESSGEYPRSDVNFYDILGKNGARMLPFYRYIVIWSGLYNVYGGSIDWANDGLGIPSFSNELWNGGSQYFTSPDLQKEMQDENSPISRSKSRYFFDDHLEFGDQYVEWTSFDHPDYGEVEMGGRWKKTMGRLPPRFMNEELCHRNAAFTLYQADEMPMMEIGETSVKKVSGDVYRVWIDLKNDKVTPTIMARAAQNNVVRPDLITLKGNVEVISASWINDKLTHDYTNPITQMIDQNDLKRLIIRNGHPGNTTRTLQYLVKGSGNLSISYDSVKGGKVSTNVKLN